MNYFLPAFHFSHEHLKKREIQQPPSPPLHLSASLADPRPPYQPRADPETIVRGNPNFDSENTI